MACRSLMSQRIVLPAVVVAGVLITLGCAWAQKKDPPARPSGSGQPAVSDEDREFLERVNRPVILRVPGMDQVRVLRDQVYQAGPKQKADVYLPRRTARPAGIVILLHGGMGPEFPLRPKDWGSYQSYGRLLAASGLVAVVHNHRAGFPKVEIPAATADLRDVIRFARAGAGKWGADPDRIGIIAFSGGGPLLSLAMREPMPYVRCQVGMYPILDIESMELFKGQMRAPELARYSPLAQLAKNPAAPPLFLARGGKDSIPDLLPGLDRFVRVALEKNADLTLVNFPDGEHGFDKQDVPRSREILHAMIAFLHAHLAVPAGQGRANP
jgi:acetyl esterase/lipase